MTAETSWTASSTETMTNSIAGLTLLVQTDPADDAIAAVRRLRDDRDAHRQLYDNVRADNKAAREQLYELADFLQELCIPTHCASGQVLTFAQRVALAVSVDQRPDGEGRK